MFFAGVVVGSIATFSIITLYSCLVVAGRADRQMEQLIQQEEMNQDK